MAREIERLTKTFLKDPAKVEVARAATTGENIEQGVVMFRGSSRENEAAEKRATLMALIDAEGAACTNAIIFCNRKTDVDLVTKSLKKAGYDAEAIHGDLDQSQRTRTLDLFRDGKLRLLIASDVAARGLDIPAVSHIFNFDVPSHSEDYVHRIGRTGRAGRSGKALTIASSKDEKNLAAIEALVQKPIPRVENPLQAAPPAPRRVETPLASDQPVERRPRGGRRDDQRVARRPSVEDNVTEGLVDETAPEVLAVPAEPNVAAEAREPQRERAPRRDHDRPDRDRRPRREAQPERHNERQPERQAERQPEHRGERVVGMGEDTPSFILMSFEERRTG